MKKTLFTLSLMLFASLCFSQGSMTVVWSNSGDDLVASYSGTLDLSGYTSGGFYSSLTVVALGPSQNIFFGNVPGSDDPESVPTHFAKQFDAYVDSGLMVQYMDGNFNGAEQTFGFYTTQGSPTANLYVPPGYVSGSEIQGQAVFANTTVFDIFGTDEFDTTVFNDGVNIVTFSSVPEPSSILLSLFGLGILLLGTFSSGSLKRNLKKAPNQSRGRVKSLAWGE